MRAALFFLVQTIGNLYICCYLLRFLLQLLRADFRNPFSQFIVSVTSPLVRPLRRIVPGIQGIDMATLLIAILLQLLLTIALISVGGLGIPPTGMLFVLVLKHLVRNFIGIFLFAVFVRALLSWVSPGGYNPLALILNSLSEPLLRPVRRLLPPVGGLDLSPMIVMIGLYALLIALS